MTFKRIYLTDFITLMKNGKLKLIAALLLLTTLGYGHEFWLEPVRFLIKQNEKIRFNLMVGEDYQGEHSNGLKYKILKLDHYSNARQEDIRSKVTGDSLSVFDLSFQEAGNHLIAFSNSSKFIQLASPKFNDYLRSEGLDNVLKIRQGKGDTIKDGRELYQRCVKTLIQVGDKTDQTYAINTGMKLEIIPKDNPYTIEGASGKVGFKVLFMQKPVVNALVLAWHLTNGKTTHTTLRSDSRGEVIFPILKTGKWMISTVHMIPNSETAVADWQSYWGSYTFGYF